MKIKVDGMHCKSCGVILTEDISAIMGISGVKVDWKKGVVEFESESLLRAVTDAIEKDGYKVVRNG